VLGEVLGLEELRNLLIERMSLGQRRRACLGAAFLAPPDLLVLDEPDNGLGVRRLDALLDLLRAHAAGACLLASHAAALLDRLGARIVPFGWPVPSKARGGTYRVARWRIVNASARRCGGHPSGSFHGR
jgi:ATPase subunit of ABC transporter with duplicated ATPase domains